MGAHLTSVPALGPHLHSNLLILSLSPRVPPSDYLSPSPLPPAQFVSMFIRHMHVNVLSPASNISRCHSPPPGSLSLSPSFSLSLSLSLL